MAILPGLAARTAAIAPLRAHGVSLGVIAVIGHKSGPFGAEDLSLLSTVATHTAVVLANARFVEMVHRGKEEWETAFDALTEGVAVLDVEGRLQRGNRALANLEVIRMILAATGKPESLIQTVQDRPGHDRRYALASEKIPRETGWQPSVDFEQGLAETVEWYRAHRAWWRPLKEGRFSAYYEQNYGTRAVIDPDLQSN